MNESNNLHWITGFLHLVFAIFISSYGLIFPKNVFDIYYILYSIIVLISWTFLNGECLITYLIKVDRNKNYKPGNDSTDLEDMSIVLKSKQLTSTLIILFILLNVYSLFIVLTRNSYPIYVCFYIPIIQLIYTISMRIHGRDLYSNMSFLTIQEITKYSTISIFAYIIYTWMKK